MLFVCLTSGVYFARRYGIQRLEKWHIVQEGDDGGTAHTAARNQVYCISGRASCGVTFHGFTPFNGRVEIGRWKGKGGE